MNDNLLNYLIATNQLDEFLGIKAQNENSDKEEFINIEQDEINEE